MTTGGSTREVIETLQAAGARVLAAGSIIDRSGGAVDLGVPRVALQNDADSAGLGFWLPQAGHGRPCRAGPLRTCGAVLG